MMAILLSHFLKRLLHNNLWEDLNTNQIFCLYSFRLEQSQKKDYKRETAESVALLKDVTFESLWVSLLFSSERKMKQTQFCIPPNPSQHSGWTEVLDWHYSFTAVGQEHATRTRGLVPCLHHHTSDKSELLPGKKDVSDASTTEQNGWDSTNMVY